MTSLYMRFKSALLQNIYYYLDDHAFEKELFGRKLSALEFVMLARKFVKSYYTLDPYHITLWIVL